MELFDKQYVHCFYDETLEGKQGFFSDSLGCLRSYVNHMEAQKIKTMTKSPDFSFPFVRIDEDDDDENEVFRFFYYDPFYELRIKYNEGYTIQLYDDTNDRWIDCVPSWADHLQYRVKPDNTDNTDNADNTDRLCTNQELMQWLAQGNGMVRDEQIDITGIIRYGHVQTTMTVNTSELDLDVIDKMIRRWDDDTWRVPMISYINKGEDNE